jgi:hypothetical protein
LISELLHCQKLKAPIGYSWIFNSFLIGRRIIMPQSRPYANLTGPELLKKLFDAAFSSEAKLFEDLLYELDGGDFDPFPEPPGVENGDTGISSISVPDKTCFKVAPPTFGG